MSYEDWEDRDHAASEVDALTVDALTADTLREQTARTARRARRAAVTIDDLAGDLLDARGAFMRALVDQLAQAARSVRPAPAYIEEVLDAMIEEHRALRTTPADKILTEMQQAIVDGDVAQATRLSQDLVWAQGDALSCGVWVRGDTTWTPQQAKDGAVPPDAVWVPLP